MISSPAVGEGQNRKRLRSLAGGSGECGNSAFQRSHTLFQDVGGGIHDAGIDIAELLQTEQRRGVVGIVEDIGSRLIDGHGARSGRGIDNLAGVNGEGSGSMLVGSDIRFLLRTALIL